MKHITSAATTTIEKAYGILLEINQPTAGIVTVNDAGNPVAVIAVGTTAQGKRYYGFTGAITVVNASTEDITLSVLARQ